MKSALRLNEELLRRLRHDRNGYCIAVGWRFYELGLYNRVPVLDQDAWLRAQPDCNDCALAALEEGE